LNGIHIGDVAEAVDKDVLMKAMEVWESLEEAENENDIIKLQKENDGMILSILL
jgi:hypothetical protein